MSAGLNERDVAARTLCVPNIRNIASGTTSKVSPRFAAVELGGSDLLKQMSPSLQARSFGSLHCTAVEITARSVIALKHARRTAIPAATGCTVAPRRTRARMCHSERAMSTCSTSAATRTPSTIAPLIDALDRDG
jgi:hypothetical protein